MEQVLTAIKAHMLYNEVERLGYLNDWLTETFGLGVDRCCEVRANGKTITAVFYMAGEKEPSLLWLRMARILRLKNVWLLVLCRYGGRKLTIL